MKKRVLSVLLAVVLAVSVLPAAMAAWTNSSPWAQNELTKALVINLIPKILNDSDLTKPITREELAEVAVALYKAAGKQAPEAPKDRIFTDTANPTVAIAHTLGIVEGVTATTFKPNDPSNRETVATMFSRAASAITSNAVKPVTGFSAKFSDMSLISSWASPHVSLLAGYNIILGANNKFMPKDMTTREQAIAIALRLLTNLERMKTTAPVAPSATPTPTPAATPTPSGTPASAAPATPSVNPGAKYTDEQARELFKTLVDKGNKFYEYFENVGMPVDDTATPEYFRDAQYYPVTGDITSLAALRNAGLTVFTQKFFDFEFGPKMGDIEEGFAPTYIERNGKLYITALDVTAYISDWVMDSVKITEQSDSKIVLSINAQMQGKTVGPKSVTIIKEGGDWKLDQSSHAII